MEAEDPIIQNSCSFRCIRNGENPTISGKVVNILPVIKKSRKQLNTVLIFHCIDISPGESNPSKKFKIFFLSETAEKVWSFKPDINDFIAIRKAVPIRDYTYNKSNLFYSKLLVVKSLKRVLFRRQQGEWMSLESVLSENSEQTRHPKITNADSTPKKVKNIISSSNGFNSSTQNEANDSDIEIIPSTDWLMAKKRVVAIQVLSNKPDHGKSGTSNTVQLTDNLDLISPSKENNSQKLINPLEGPSKIRSPESLMQGIVRSHQRKSNDKNISSRNATSQLKCVYTKLANIQENMVVNIVGIIHTISKTFTKTSTKKMCMIIYVVDETNRDGFRIRVFCDLEKDQPVLQQYYLILCQEMKISKVGNELCGTIFHSRQIVTFDRDDPKICYKQSSNFSLTSEDEERVERLRNWMFQNMPTARPFTPLASIANKTDTVNLRCRIIDVKVYDKNIIVLRVSDGTICEVPFLRIPFECDTWQRAISEMKSNHEPSKEIDVIVHVRYDYLYRKFKLELKTDTIVELFNVNLKLLPDPVQTKPGNALKAYLEGDAQNIRVTRENDELLLTNSFYQTSVSKTSKTKSNRAISRITNKRKLFEHSPRNENVDSDETDFEGISDIAVMPPKQSKSVAKSSNPKSIGPTTSSTNLTRAKNSDTNTMRDILPEDNLPPSSAKSSGIEQAIDLLSDTNSSVAVRKSHSTERISSVDSQLDSISLARIAREKAASKSVCEHLYRSVKSVIATERKAIQKRLTDYTTKNDVSNYFVQWPSNPGDEAFYIQVTIMSTIPCISGSSSDFDLLGLISGYCDTCDRFFPFHLAKWFVSDDDGPVSICPKCKEYDVMSPLKHELLCEFLLNDDFGTSVPGIVLSHHAENFFGCTVSQLCSSAEAKIRVRTFVDNHVFAKGKEKRPLIVKVIRIYSAQYEVYRYHILS